MANTGDRQHCYVLQRIDLRDLDQLTVAEATPAGAAKILVAAADVDAVVKKHSALDDYTRQNTGLLRYPGIPMLPEKLSTDLTSLNYESDRLAATIPRPVVTARCLSISGPPELSPCYSGSDDYQPGFPYRCRDLALGHPLKTNSPAVIIEERPTRVVGQSYL
jgi:hypothetical protein